MSPAGIGGFFGSILAIAVLLSIVLALKKLIENIIRGYKGK